MARRGTSHPLMKEAHACGWRVPRPGQELTLDSGGGSLLGSLNNAGAI